MDSPVLWCSLPQILPSFLIYLRNAGYKTGVSLSKPQMKVVEQSLERNPELPKWDILIHP